MDKDTVLRHLFSAMATRNCGEPGYGAGVCILGGMEYDICQVCVFQGQPLDCYAGAAQGRMMQFEDLPLMKMSDPNRVRPEIMLDSDKVPLPDGQARMLLEPGMYMIPDMQSAAKAGRMFVVASTYKLPYGKYVQKSHVAVPAACMNMPQMKLMAYSLPDDVAGVLHECKADIAEFVPCIMQSRLQLQPVLMLTGETSLLYMPLRRRAESDSIASLQMADGSVLFADGWSEDQRTFKRLVRRKENMKSLLANPLVEGKKKDAIKPVAAPTAPAPAPAPAKEPELEPEDVVQQADGSQPEVSEAVTVQVDTSVKPAGDGATEAEVEATQEAAEPAQAEEQPEAPDKTAEQDKPKAPARKAKPAAAGTIGDIKLHEALETLQVAVPSIGPDEFDAGLNAIRTLRDIQIAAARLLANVSLKMLEGAKTGDKSIDMQQVNAKLAELQKMLGK